MSVALPFIKHPFEFIPGAPKDRASVEGLSEKELQIAIKTADMYGQQVILQDLLIAGGKLETKEQHNIVSLAAQLFVQSSKEAQGTFLFRVLETRDQTLFYMFANAILVNSVRHMMYPDQRSPNLTKEYLNLEKEYATTLNYQRQE